MFGTYVSKVCNVVDAELFKGHQVSKLASLACVLL